MKFKRYYILSLLCCCSSLLAATRYGETLCQTPHYTCLTVQKEDSWETLFPNEEIRTLIQRINRMNVRLKSGMHLAIPKTIDENSLYTTSPLPVHVDSIGEKFIYISQRLLAWGAYDANGDLVWWGPISSGSDQCQLQGGCATPSGFFRIIRKNDETCESTAFPQTNSDPDDLLSGGGAPMPYCMHFFRGYALHGSRELPGYRASHGCIRLFYEDAEWLNEEFIDLPGGGMKGTRVMIEES